MIQSVNLRVDPKTAASHLLLIMHVSNELHIDANRIQNLRVVRRSIDARQRKVMLNVTVKVALDTNDPLTIANHIDYQPLPSDAPVCIVVGAGPAVFSLLCDSLNQA